MKMRLSVTIQAGRIALDKKVLRATMRQAGNEIAATARALIRKSSGSGRMYRGKRASAPGQPPVGRTGELAKGLKVEVFRSGEGVRIVDKARSAGGSGSPYALFLEAGSVGGVASFQKGVKGRVNVSKRINRKYTLIKATGSRVVLPRPFLTTALAMKEASIAQRIAVSINQGLKFVREKP